MAAFNDGATSWQLPDGSRVVIAIENAQKLKRWFGGQAPDFWNILHSASRMQLLFGVRMLVVANTTAKGEAERWAKAPGVIHLTRKMFPGGALANEVGLPRY